MWLSLSETSQSLPVEKSVHYFFWAPKEAINIIGPSCTCWHRDVQWPFECFEEAQFYPVLDGRIDGTSVGFFMTQSYPWNLEAFLNALNNKKFKKPTTFKKEDQSTYIVSFHFKKSLWLHCKYWNLSHTNTLGEGEGGGSAGLRVVKVGDCVPAILRLAFREALISILREAVIGNKNVWLREELLSEQDLLARPEVRARAQHRIIPRATSPLENCSWWWRVYEDIFYGLLPFQWHSWSNWGTTGYVALLVSFSSGLKVSDLAQKWPFK